MRKIEDYVMMFRGGFSCCYLAEDQWCKNQPLVALKIGGILSSKDEHDWRYLLPCTCSILIALQRMIVQPAKLMETSRASDMLASKLLEAQRFNSFCPYSKLQTFPLQLDQFSPGIADV